MKQLMMQRKTFLVPVLGSLAILSLGASAHAAPQKPKPEAMKVELKNAQGTSLGTAELSHVKQGVRVKLDLSQVTPGTHGIHFHEKGLCEGPDFKSAGEHFNPAGKEHGMKNPKGTHAGDMPNIEANSSGVVKREFVVKGVTLGEGESSLRRFGGTSIVLHAKADDHKTNPAGDSGDRIACGMIAGREPEAAATLAPEAQKSISGATE
jgi:Cu-Zn family superoxide dismutase